MYRLDYHWVAEVMAQWPHLTADQRLHMKAEWPS